MLVTTSEAGRGLFNGYVKFLPREFKKAVHALTDECQNSRDKMGDQELYQKLLNLFMDTFCTTADARLQVNAFFKQQVEAKINAKVDVIYQVKSQSSALISFLWDSKRGEIEETTQERQRQKALIEAGEASFKAFKAGLGWEQKANCKRAADTALENLAKSRQDIYDKLNAKTHQWDCATHTLTELPVRGDRRTESESSSASRDLKLNEISIFVTQFFAERDRSAVEAYLIDEVLKEVRVKSKEIYIHYTEGWAGSLHATVSNNLKKIFQEFSEFGPCIAESSH